jgi:disulfide bond formation protein DsbB
MLPYLAWIQALVAAAASLAMSEILHLTPCTLCWYQRIAMYPLVLVIGVGIVLGDRRVALYALPASVIGLVIAAYHNVLYYGVLPEAIAQCSLGVSCTERQLELFGLPFLTIPTFSLVAFAVITVSLTVYHHWSRPHA